jgi:hypothetical protein
MSAKSPSHSTRTISPHKSPCIAPRPQNENPKFSLRRLRLLIIGASNSYCRGRPAFFAVFFKAFFAAFLTGILFAAIFFATLAGDFFGAFFVTVFFVVLFEDAFSAGLFDTTFFAAFLAGAFLRTSVTVVTAAPIAVLMAPAISDAIAIPTPTVSPVLSTIVFSAIL